ncbi:MAG: precorrin-6Y C5,15-methyltransferase (decarboxylating) subunit CbiT [Candidatus Bathyarchaeota archaeon]|nr:precorrin-6Y C5,15-methyltransferase (decarboxylating) subunit CbiT [Candidatus Bathyarchaeota archaeon]
MTKEWIYKTPGIPDEAFNQNEKVPGPTKEEIRVITISKARLSEGAVVVDVGCGTGGLTVEAALQVGSKGRVYALDEDPNAVELTKSNVHKFAVENQVSVTLGKAPGALLSLPRADAFLVGGGGVSLRPILQFANAKLNPNGRIVVNAILLETATVAVDELKALRFVDIDVAAISVAKGKQINSGTMMLARNPVTIVSATKI